MRYLSFMEEKRAAKKKIKGNKYVHILKSNIDQTTLSRVKIWIVNKDLCARDPAPPPRNILPYQKQPFPTPIYEQKSYAFNL